MKKKFICVAAFMMAIMLSVLVGTVAEAKAIDAGAIKTGVYADEVELSGMTAEEAEAAIEEYVASLKDEEITLIVADGNKVTTTAGEIGLEWTNREIAEEAVTLGTEGNIVQRYKALTDLRRENKVYDITFSVDEEAIRALIEDECTKYDAGVENYKLIRENDVFKIVDGKTGYGVDVETSVSRLVTFMETEGNHESAEVELEVVVKDPEGSVEELSQIKDILGTSTTSFATSGSSRSANVTNGCNLINGITLYPGEEFSTYETIAPFSVENGYYPAGSYLNGKVVESLGGGICQVSTTLYNAVLQAELEVTERHNHSMIVTYVEPSADAAIAESAGKDFKFVNNLDYPIYIEGIITPDKHITFNIYGVETRETGRVVTYESKILSVTNPDTELVYTDAAQPVGYVSAIQSAHIGYKAQLWKVVTVNGVEESRTQVNSSSYKMTPRSVTIGVATDNPDIYNQVMAAVATSNIDHVRGVVAALTGAPAAPADPTVQQPTQPADVPANSDAVQQPQPEQQQPAVQEVTPEGELPPI